MFQGLVAERQILFDPINVGRSENRRLSQGSPPLGTLALKQVAPPGSSMHDFAAGRNLETLGHGFLGLVTFGSPHTGSLSLKSWEWFPRSAWVMRNSRLLS